MQNSAVHLHVMWLHPSFSSTIDEQLKHLCHPFCLAISTNSLVAGSLGHSRELCILLLQVQHTRVLHRLHLPTFRPCSTVIWLGLIHSPQPRAGQ